MNAQGPSADTRSSSAYQRNAPPTLICFSHLRWAFVFQRPQHLMTRFAATYRVLFWEEPEFRAGGGEPRVRRHECPDSGVVVLTPELDESLRGREDAVIERLLAEAVPPSGLLVRWYYTPMMLPFSDRLAADCVVYDCMDELSAFRGAPPELLEHERMLLECFCL